MQQPRAHPQPRYRFGPLERRGLIGSLSPGQLVLGAVVVLLAIAVVNAFKNGFGLGLASMVLGGGALAVFTPVHGRTVNEWIPVMASYLARRAAGRHRYRSAAPEAGTRFQSGDEPVTLPEALGKLEIIAFPFRGVELGVIADRKEATYTAVVQARARSFVLLDTQDKVQRLAGWASALAGLAREGSPIHRVQWVERTVPEDRHGLHRYLRDAMDRSLGLDSPQLQSYLRLIESAAPATEQHELFIALQISAVKAARAIKQAGGKDTGACAVLARELDSFARRMEAAEVEVMHALGPRRLAAAIRHAYDPNARAQLARLALIDPQRDHGVSPRNAWPRSAEAGWSWYRTNDVYHRTYWIAEWPRLDVGTEFLAPLLVQTQCMRTVAVTMEPVPPLKAMRAVGFAKTADIADEELRARLGFIPTAKRRNQAEAVARREQELADGHADFRFSGYITVTAPDRESLEHACGEVEHAAGQARLEIQPCDGEQDVCFTYTLPLGRGLR